MARAVANETGAFFFLINGPEIMSKMAGGRINEGVKLHIVRRLFWQTYTLAFVSAHYKSSGGHARICAGYMDRY
jgi:hypothetical protein